jgi:hypothetical protein
MTRVFIFSAGPGDLDEGLRSQPRLITGTTMALPRTACRAACLAGAVWLAGCAGDVQVSPPARSPEAIRADIAARLPTTLADRQLW